MQIFLRLCAISFWDENGQNHDFDVKYDLTQFGNEHQLCEWVLGF